MNRLRGLSLFRRVVGLSLFACLAPGAALAERVVFDDLRVLEVERVERKGETVVLHLPGGGYLTTPAARIREIRPDRVQPKPEEPKSDAWRNRAGDFENFFESAAERYELDPELLLAVAIAESALDPGAVSPKGAMGLMQLMPATADELSVSDPHDPEQNIAAGAAWLRRMLDRFEGDLDLALAAYNAGENAVRRFGGIPPYDETRNYVARVRRTLRRLQAGV